MIKEGYDGLNPFFDEKRRIIFETGTRCNLLCPGCGRTKAKNTNSYLPIQDFSLEDFKTLFSPENKIKESFWGLAYSDPIYCGKLFEMFDHLNTLPLRPKIAISTNGSGRNVKWWEKFASVLNDVDRIEFAVDGLEDTNHIYRVNAKFNTIMLGMQALTKKLKELNKKTTVSWRFIVFEHNYHQVADACVLAKNNGCHQFKLIEGDHRTPPEMILKSKRFEEVEESLNEQIKNLSGV